MKKNFMLAGVLVLLFVLLVALNVGVGTIFPRFAAPGSCDDAAVTIYNAVYDAVKGDVSMLVRNGGSTSLQLETFTTDAGGAVTKRSLVIYISPGSQTVATLSGLESRPAVLTVRDTNCAVADLWKF